MARRSRTALVLAACSLGLLCSAATATYYESVTFVRPGVTSIERARGVAADSENIGLSHGAMTASLRDCTAGLQRAKSLEMAYLPQSARGALYSGCLDLAHNVLVRSPANGFGWFASANAALLTGDVAAFNSSLAISQLVSPTEQWIAEQRVQLAEDNLGLLDAQATAAHYADLRMLVSGGLGLRSLARRYVWDKDFRERITAIVESMPVQNQQRFLNTLRSAIRNAGR